jgi:hypothetical protein
MPGRTVICKSCGATTHIPDADWSSVQASLILAWKVRHELDAHQGDDIPDPRIKPTPPGPLHQKKWDRFA